MDSREFLEWVGSCDISELRKFADGVAEQVELRLEADIWSRRDPEAGERGKDNDVHCG